jgi:hypothetical protein
VLNRKTQTQEKQSLFYNSRDDYQKTFVALSEFDKCNEVLRYLAGKRLLKIIIIMKNKVALSYFASYVPKVTSKDK